MKALLNSFVLLMTGTALTLVIGCSLPQTKDLT
jgi:hypothetical protein